MTNPTDHQDITKRIEALLRDRKALKAILPRIIEKAETVYPPYLQHLLDHHSVALDEARLYAAGVSPTLIADRRGKTRQNVDGEVVSLARRYLHTWPELLEFAS